jgi:hypothetical protein
MAYAVIRIGAKDVPMMSNAATPIRYRQVFRKNLNSFFLGKMPEEESADLPGELAYIMAKSASGADMNKLSYDDYVDWLCGFEALDFSAAVTPILNVYQNNLESSSEVKKNLDQPTEK